MKIAAIICEFNPLHSGHKRLIDYAKSIAEHVVCIMSGNFTQRGLPACADKYSRAKHAVMSGADMVIELPTVFATASAQNFARGGMAIAHKIGADYLVFGSECGDLQQLNECVRLLDKSDVQQQIKRQMSLGVSYPKAVATATGCAALDKPNNTLAVEYLRAIAEIDNSIMPFTLQREDNFNGKCGQFASSAALRQNKDLRDKYSYDFVCDDINDTVVDRYCDFATKFMSVADMQKLQQIEGVTEGLENRIVAADKAHGFEKMMEDIKTKRYTRLKLQRIVLNCILDIRRNDVQLCKQTLPATKVLAVRKSAATLLSRTDNQSDEITTRADNLYRSLTGCSYPTKLPVFD